MSKISVRYNTTAMLPFSCLNQNCHVEKCSDTNTLHKKMYERVVLILCMYVMGMT